MPNVNLTLPTLPTSDQKDAMDNANTPDASNPFLTNNDLPATPDLNTVLAAGSTSNTPINSTNGRSTVSFTGVSTFISFVQGTVTSLFSASNLSSIFSWTNGTKTGSVTANVTKTEIAHTDLINLSATSVTKNGSEIATEAYANSLVVGLWDDRGSFDASGGAYPSSGGSGTAGAILKGDIWTISVAGTLPTGQVVEIGDVVRALIDTPGNTQANWGITQNNIGYVAENSANKTNTVAGNEASTTLYLSVKGYYDYLVGLVWLTAQLFGTWISGLVSKATPVDADIIPLMDSADTNKTKGLSWANFKATLKTYFDTLYAPASQLDTFTIPFSSLNFNPADSTTYYFAGANALAPAVTDTNYDSNFGYAFVIIGCTIGCYGNATQGSNENSVLQFRNVTQGTSTVIGNFTSDGTATMIQYTTMTGLNISVAATDWGCIQWDTPVWATNPGSVRTTGFLICKRV